MSEFFSHSMQVELLSVYYDSINNPKNMLLTSKKKNIHLLITVVPKYARHPSFAFEI